MVVLVAGSVVGSVTTGLGPTDQYEVLEAVGDNSLSHPYYRTELSLHNH